MNDRPSLWWLMLFIGRLWCAALAWLSVLLFFVVRQTASSEAVQVVGALGFLLTLQHPLLSQVVTDCPGAKFYPDPSSGMSVSPEVPSGGIGMIRASGFRNRLSRDPHRINSWVEVFVVGGRGGDPRGPIG